VFSSYLRLFTVSIWLGVFSSTTGFSQSSSIDSLKALLQTKSTDSLRIDRLNALGIRLRSTALKEALAYANEAYQLSLDKRDTVRLVQSAISMGIAYSLQGDHSAVDDLMNKTEPLALRINDQQNLGNVYLLRGRVSEVTAKYNEAIAHFRKAITHFEQSKHAVIITVFSMHCRA